MRPLAKAVTKTLEKVRSFLREQCLSPTPHYTEEIHENLKIFDRLFSEFEFAYVSCMVHVKTTKGKQPCGNIWTSKWQFIFIFQSLRSSRTSSVCSLTPCREQYRRKWSPKKWWIYTTPGKSGFTSFSLTPMQSLSGCIIIIKINKISRLGSWATSFLISCHYHSLQLWSLHQ